LLEDDIIKSSELRGFSIATPMEMSQKMPLGKGRPLNFRSSTKIEVLKIRIRAFIKAQFLLEVDIWTMKS